MEQDVCRGHSGKVFCIKGLPCAVMGKASCVGRIELDWEPTALASGWRLDPKTEQRELVSPIAEIPSMEDVGVGVRDS